MAVIPLVISALEHYAEGVSTITKWWSYKSELNSLVRVLDAEYARFLRTCEKLLHGLVSPAELKALIEHPGGPLWKDRTLDRKLKIRLQMSYSSYTRSIEDMVEAVRELEAKLEIGPKGRVSNVSNPGLTVYLKFYSRSGEIIIRASTNSKE